LDSQRILSGESHRLKPKSRIEHKKYWQAGNLSPIILSVILDKNRAEQPNGTIKALRYRYSVKIRESAVFLMAIMLEYSRK
jgi:hypothetical protein